MTFLVAIDPGKTTGMAVFKDLILAHAYYGTPEKMLETMDPGVVALAVIEKPKWRPHSHEEIDDLLGVAILVGRFQEALESQGAKVELVWPNTWKGSVDKKIHNQRVLEALTAEERALVPLRPRAKTPDHNCVDAIGLGLWKLGRLRR